MRRAGRLPTFALTGIRPQSTRGAGVATIETVTEGDGGLAVEPATAQQAEPPSITAQTIAPDHRHTTVHQRSTTLLATVLGAVVTALLGGMFLFIVSALDRVSEEIDRVSEEIDRVSEEVSSLRGEISGLRGEFSGMSGEIDRVSEEIDRVSEEVSSLRSEMNARFVEADRRFDQIYSVLMDHTDRLARIETTLDISGRPLPSETDDPTGP